MRLEKFSCSERGFSLIEVVVATGILTVVSLGVAQMFALATQKNLAGKQQLSTTTMATQKMEQLRSLTFAYDASGMGLPVTDTTTNLAKCTADTTGVGLNPSPSNALDTDRTGFVDYLDATGACLDTSGAVWDPANPGTVRPTFTRRWSIVPLPTNPNNTLVLTVLVTPTGKELRRGPTPPEGRTRFVEDSMLITARSRKAP